MAERPSHQSDVHECVVYTPWLTDLEYYVITSCLDLNYLQHTDKSKLCHLNSVHCTKKLTQHNRAIHFLPKIFCGKMK